MITLFSRSITTPSKKMAKVILDSAEVGNYFLAVEGLTTVANLTIMVDILPSREMLEVMEAVGVEVSCNSSTIIATMYYDDFVTGVDSNK